MKVSCRFAMAVHVMAVLAYKEGDRVTSAVLAESINTNPVVIRRLLLSLQQARLVETCKGAGAGSRLTRAPRRINLAQIYKAVEDPHPFVSPSRNPSAACPVGSCIRRVLNDVFSSAEAALERELQKTTMADLLVGVRTPHERAVQAGV